MDQAIEPEMSPESKVHGANMRPTWVLSAPDGPHVDPMNLVIRIPWVNRANDHGIAQQLVSNNIQKFTTRLEMSD